MDSEVEYEIQRWKERMESKIAQLDYELRLVISRKADKDHYHDDHYHDKEVSIESNYPLS